MVSVLVAMVGTRVASCRQGDAEATDCRAEECEDDATVKQDQGLGIVDDMLVHMNSNFSSCQPTVHSLKYWD